MAWLRAGQKAPSAIRCINTKLVSNRFDVMTEESESTERHKVH